MKNMENLCVIAIEECAELQQALSKSLRFGFDNYHPDTPEKTNAMDILNEYYQLVGVMELLMESGQLKQCSPDVAEFIKKNKKQKVSDYTNLSISLGRVEKEPS